METIIELNKSWIVLGITVFLIAMASIAIYYLYSTAEKDYTFSGVAFVGISFLLIAIIGIGVAAGNNEFLNQANKDTIKHIVVLKQENSKGFYIDGESQPGMGKYDYIWFRDNLISFLYEYEDGVDVVRVENYSNRLKPNFTLVIHLAESEQEYNSIQEEIAVYKYKD